MFEQFPYANFHEMNMDWIIKVVKDFLSKYEYIEELIRTGKEDIVNLTAEEMQALTDKKEELEALLQAWYDSHSEDIARELDRAISAFYTAADNKAEQAIASIPSDYTTLSNEVSDLKSAITELSQNLIVVSDATNGYFNGLTFTNNKNGTVTINGTSTNAGILTLTDAVTLNPGYYSFGLIPPAAQYAPGQVELQIRDYSGGQDGGHLTPPTLSKASFNLNESKTVRFRFFYASGVTFTNFILRPVCTLAGLWPSVFMGHITAVDNVARSRLYDVFGAERTFKDESGIVDVVAENSQNLLGVSDPNGNIVLNIDRFGKIETPGFNSNDINMQIIPFSSKYDLAVTDPLGNTLIAVKNGDIVTSKLSGKKVSILGDSISTYSGYNPEGYATHYPTGNVNNVEKTWWKKLINETGMTLLSNASWAGSRVTGDSQGNAYAGCSDARIAALAGANGEQPDVILVYITTNDWGNNPQREIGNFDSTSEIPAEGEIVTISNAYALMLYKIRNAYPLAQVFCITSLEGRRASGDTTYPIINSHNQTICEVNKAISEIAQIFGANVINLQTCGIHYWNVGTYTVDGTVHPNAAGMEIIKNKVLSVMLHDYINK